MRIITDGKRFAVARRRWLFTQFLSAAGFWWGFTELQNDEFDFWYNTKEEAYAHMQRKIKQDEAMEVAPPELKYWDVTE